MAAALATYSREELVALAHQADPDLADEELADSMRALDALEDEVLTREFSAEQVRGQAKPERHGS